jgi:putative toxin-antitoxin system antitoxin component (TIGR02293 family)
MREIKTGKKQKKAGLVYPAARKAGAELHDKKTPGYRTAGNGVVQHYIHGANTLASLSHDTATPAVADRAGQQYLAEVYEELSPANMVRMVGAGLAVDELEALREGLGWSMERLVPKVGLSIATYHRRKLGGAGRLTADESDKVIRYTRLLAKAIEVLGGDEQARSWLNAEQFGLGGAVPLEYAATEVGAREVEDLLGRIDYGVYS